VRQKEFQKKVPGENLTGKEKRTRHFMQQCRIDFTAYKRLKNVDVMS
jgi:hypothetical protein